ncbi:MAG: YdcF family protein [Deltaproteobacteria bacterium]|nr:YdcF family protein [Deltaproteobacteria bacterium]
MAKGFEPVFKILKGFCVGFTVTALFIMYTPVANLLAKRLTIEPEPRKADLIAVLGGGAYINGVLGGASNERLVHGLLLYKQGFANRIIFSGGTIASRSKKLMHTLFRSNDSSGVDISEADIMDDIARKLGVPENQSVSDPLSTNTYENLTDIREYMQRNGLKTCILVTSPTHIYRAYSVAKKLGMDCSPAPVKDYTSLRTSGLERLSLLREALREYAALALYRAYGYI